MKNIILFSLAIVLGLCLTSCKNNEDPDAGLKTGNIVLDFEHYADGQPLVFDDMKYVNAAGNPYEITEIQWFISDITLNKTDGTKLLLDEENFAQYIDTNLPETFQREIDDPVPAGDYSSITFTFGIKGEKNEPLMYTDPPESYMLWPINLGGDKGGYHYMKLNGFWKNTSGDREPFNFHLGVGQERDSENNITGFVQNWFETELPVFFTVAQNDTVHINIRMNIEKWWDQPNTYDFNVVGGKIMQNQEAMRMGVENGKNVFSATVLHP
jgi:hypothetical protein